MIQDIYANAFDKQIYGSSDLRIVGDLRKKWSKNVFDKPTGSSDMKKSDMNKECEMAISVLFVLHVLNK